MGEGYSLFAELVAEVFDIDAKLFRDHLPGAIIVIFAVVSRPRICLVVRKWFGDAELSGDKTPVFFESFKSTDEIGKHIAVAIDKPIQLIAMRGRVEAGGAGVLDPTDKLIEAHFVFHLPPLHPIVKRNNAVPGIANEAELEIGIESLLANFRPPAFGKGKVQELTNTILSATEIWPVARHVQPDFRQVHVRLPRLAQNDANARGRRLRHFYKNAFVLAGNHLILISAAGPT